MIRFTSREVALLQPRRTEESFSSKSFTHCSRFSEVTPSRGSSRWAAPPARALAVIPMCKLKARRPVFHGVIIVVMTKIHYSRELIGKDVVNGESHPIGES